MPMIRVLKVATCFLCLTWLASSPAVGQNTQADVKHDTSPALRDIPPVRPEAKALGAIRQEHIVKKLPPLPSRPRALRAPTDTVHQKSAPQPLKAAPATTFEGIGDANYRIASDPPDTNGAAGTTQYVEWVNTAFAVFDKTTGKMVLGPADGKTLWHGFGGNCEQFNDGDPIVQYDKVANRWVMTQFAVSGGAPFSQCIAVSTTPDATGPYGRYEFQFSDFNDYPKFGVWPDGYYASFNMFRGDSFIGAKACVFERAKMLTGEAARMQCFDVNNMGGLLPADLDGATAPPGGSPNYFVNFGRDQLNLWKFHVDWTNQASSTFTGPTAIPTAPFEVACDDCIPQPRVSQTLQSLSDRLMYRLAYRQWPDHESLVVNHTVTAGGRVGVRWYELRNLQGTPTIQQQGTFAPDSLFRWMGSIAMDKVGNMAMGYSVSSRQVSPSIRYTGRTVSDPPNQMAAEQKLMPGKGAQKSPDRWGDYSSISVDPTDDCTFWFTTQYLAGSGSFNWHTAIARIKFTNCQ
jgi:hypothetical protein